MLKLHVDGTGGLWQYSVQVKGSDSKASLITIPSHHKLPPMGVCNNKWIVFSSGTKVLVVWRVLDGPDAVVQQTVMWDSCTWLSDLQSMEFFCLDGDSHLERSDLLHMFLLQTRGTALFLCLLQIDLSTLGQEDGVITHPEFVVECNLSQLGLSSDNLCRPLINRSAHESQYYMPFTTKKEQSLLELSTGATFTWLEDSTGLEVNAVDESHISTTTSDHSSTSVFALPTTTTTTTTIITTTLTITTVIKSATTSTGFGS
ncbi:hypothetical protein Pelo_3990 [Pelomyxa schiedti]|nr:hypothetical protein Pelo_3990 [Pelomyxa schiedti]